ncbi:Os03g0392833 [Oryza sativa Japonica Group]|uniref:Os03g0392833 protein n=1 Tax=Oryza sativa subsp. japonica TaxID=39947 RepID=A0A0P0VY98_ORYSJ|nr:Os03g0392833 [Oryza sativa Japonica Group]
MKVKKLTHTTSLGMILSFSLMAPFMTLRMESPTDSLLSRYAEYAGGKLLAGAAPAATGSIPVSSRKLYTS